MKLLLVSSTTNQQKLDRQALTSSSGITELSDAQLSYVSGGAGGCSYDARHHVEYCCSYDKHHNRHCYRRTPHRRR